MLLLNPPGHVTQCPLMSRDAFCWRLSPRFLPWICELIRLLVQCHHRTGRLNTAREADRIDLQPSVAPRMWKRASTLSTEGRRDDVYAVGLRQKGGIVFTSTRKKVHLWKFPPKPASVWGNVIKNKIMSCKPVEWLVCQRLRMCVKLNCDSALRSFNSFVPQTH